MAPTLLEHQAFHHPLPAPSLSISLISGHCPTSFLFMRPDAPALRLTLPPCSSPAATFSPRPVSALSPSGAALRRSQRLPSSALSPSVGAPSALQQQALRVSSRASAAAAARASLSSPAPGSAPRPVSHRIGEALAEGLAAGAAAAAAAAAGSASPRCVAAAAPGAGSPSLAVALSRRATAELLASPRTTAVA